MEFKSLKNLETSFRQIRLFGIIFLSLCAVVVVYSVYSSYAFAEKQREKIYENGLAHLRRKQSVFTPGIRLHGKK